MKIFNRLTGQLMSENRGNDFVGKNLMNAALGGMQLNHADFREANLRSADLSNAFAFYASFNRADMRYTDLTDTTFYAANFLDTDFRNATLKRTDFRASNMHRANFSGCDVGTCFFKNANLNHANFEGATGLEKHNIVPSGEFTAYKKLYAESNKTVVATLVIPSEARRLNAIGRRICRADRARVQSIVDIEGNAYNSAHSLRDPTFTYTVGKLITCEKPFNTDLTIDCASGIHFFLTLDEAWRYGG